MSVCAVTGGAGLLGSHIAKHLVQLGHDVLVIDNLSGGDARNIPPKCAFFAADVTDFYAMRDIFRTHTPEYVFHCAAYAAEGLSPFIRGFNYYCNVVGSANLISLAIQHEIKRFVFLSSIAVYGKAEIPYQEYDAGQPIDPYGIAKWAVEQDLRQANEQFGVPYTIFRPYNVAGEGQNVNDPYRNVVGIFLRQALTGQPLTIFGDGEQSRKFSYVGDVCPIIAESAFDPRFERHSFNIGGDEVMSINTLAKEVARVCDVPLHTQYTAARHEVQHALADTWALNQLLPLRTITPLPLWLPAYRDWVVERGIGSPTPLPTTLEVTRGLPELWQQDHA